MSRIVWVVGLAIASLAVGPAFAQPASDPINKPDEFAWKLFEELHRPANRFQKPGDDGLVVWETWMPTTHVFLQSGKRPSPWDEYKPDSNETEGVDINSFVSARKIDLDETIPFTAMAASRFERPNQFGRNVMNRTTFEFIVSNELYNIEGQEAFHRDRKTLNLPLESKLIKSSWKLLDPTPYEDLAADKILAYRARFHTTLYKPKTSTKHYLYGLTGVHITTKDLPNWFWATFEHVDNPPPELDDNDRAGRPASFDGTKWQFFRLRGTQTDFVDSTGQPTILANTQIEQGFQQSSSCITCHSRATIGAPIPGNTVANRLPAFDRRRITVRQSVNNTAEQVIKTGPLGSPSPDWFYENQPGDMTGPERKYTQLDFIWSFRGANRKPK